MKMVGEYFDYFRSSSFLSDMILKIIKVSIDALVQTENFEYLFEVLAKKIDPKIFWEQIETFIISKQIRKIPESTIPEACEFLGYNSAQLLCFNLDYDEEYIDRIVSVSLNHKKPLNQVFIFFALLHESTVPLALTNFLTTAKVSAPNKYRPFWLVKRLLEYGGFPNERFGGIKFQIKRAVYEWFFTSSNLEELFALDSYLASEIIYSSFLDIDLWMIDHNHIKTLSPVVSSDNYETKIMKFIPMNDHSLASTLLKMVAVTCIDKNLQSYLWLVVKALSLSNFSYLMDEIIWVITIIDSLVEFPFEESRYCLHYELLSKYDFEEHITRVLLSFDKDKILILDDLINSIEKKCEINQFYRVRALIEELHNRPWNALNIYLNIKYLSDEFYIFEWIHHQFNKLTSGNYIISPNETLNKSQSDGYLQNFCAEVIDSLDKLIKIDDARTKSVVVRIPNCGHDTLKSLSHFPDLQINY
jgi:hypothetical protein